MTAEGQTVIAHMREIAGHMEQIEQKVAALNGLTIGDCQSGAFPVFLHGIFLHCLRYSRNSSQQLMSTFMKEDMKTSASGSKMERSDIGFTALPVQKVDFIPLLKTPFM